MQRIFMAACVAASMLFGLTTASLAETYKISLAEVNAYVTFPDSWKVNEIKRGAEALTKDQEVVLWAEAFVPDEFDKLMAEHDAYYKDHKVTFTGKPETEAVAKNGIKFTALEMNATYKGEKTFVRYLVIDPGLKNGAKLLISTWSSVAGDEKYEKETDSIVGSIKFRK